MQLSQSTDLKRVGLYRSRHKLELLCVAFMLTCHVSRNLVDCEIGVKEVPRFRPKNQAETGHDVKSSKSARNIKTSDLLDYHKRLKAKPTLSHTNLTPKLSVQDSGRSASMNHFEDLLAHQMSRVSVGGQFRNPLFNKMPLLSGDKLEELPKHALKRHNLPTGPPPFIPSPLALKFRSMSTSKLGKPVINSKVYYLFLDTLRQLNLMVNDLATKKLRSIGGHLMGKHLLANQIASKVRHSMKLKWPLVMLNPNFVREILSNPTFLVMLFHAVEVAYASSAKGLLLKPLVKLVAQPSYEKEEKIWWRRKRLYDTLNGHGSSELQPNLKTKHFRQPGKPTPIAVPKLANLVRKLAKKAPPNPAYYRQPISESVYYPARLRAPEKFAESSVQNGLKSYTLVEPDKAQTLIDETHDGSDYPQVALSAQQSQDDWLAFAPTKEQLMSQQEFDSLDPREREQVIKQAQMHLEESRWINDLIKQHHDFVESLAKRSDRGRISLDH